MIGKWHYGDYPEFMPTRHGFDEYYGIPYKNDRGRQARGNTQFSPLPLLSNEEIIQEQPHQVAVTERYVEHAVRFIRNYRENHFFLYLAHMYVHLPIYTPDRFLKQSGNGSYGPAVKCIDWTMAVILDKLQRLGLDQNTLVVSTSDNGSRGNRGGNNHQLRGCYGTTWEGDQRVSCIMRWPHIQSQKGAINAVKSQSKWTSSLCFHSTSRRK